ncbi:cbb3-type cytochrome oxidase assembly protein CcoS [Mangrovimicrobium sediminis]|uniref:Cbb3-type cytochrome oxidase assembly protein CcoS n=1 Tax=Mangrovimicrobium sediminis TaxID=2562682 RepID=A0A4Z0M5H1_9GAMM|nr:cbb3-type cytochrome oxidase assembly protein CcoS [Haliea sp. SAOS-164]TGD74555.1 cbb3-type cytochrome oxidase assembly protein CcoS [Haliea sp. SAOS-164]
MDSLYLLIPVALVFVALGIKLLLWAIDSGQYDDLDKEAWRILNDDEGQDSHAQNSSAQDSGDPKP